MDSFEVVAEVPENRRAVIVLPSTVPTGKVKLTVGIESESAIVLEPRTSSLADWVEENAEHLGDRIRSDDVEGFTGRRFF